MTVFWQEATTVGRKCCEIAWNDIDTLYSEKNPKKVIGKRAFKPCKTERLTPSQQLRRVTMSRLLLAQPNLLNKLKHVWFTDESWFTTDGITQKNNQFYWALNKDAVKPVISQKYPIKVHVWAAISVSGVIGPYFFHRAGRNITVNQYTYQECVKWFIDQLKERRKISRAILMQDGATPHTALSTRSFLTSNFGNRLIGKHFAVEWPPQSPDLTPADYYLWPTLKRLVYHSPEPYRSLLVLGLKRAIIFHMRKMARWNHDHLLESVKRRWEWCVRVHGARLHKEVNGYMSLRSLLCKILFLTHFKQCFTRLLSGQLLSAIQYILQLIL